MCKQSCGVCYPSKRKARMPWQRDIAHTKLPDGRVVLRGSPEEAKAKYGDLCTCADNNGTGWMDCSVHPQQCRGA